ncbi:MAG: DUF898 family protein [Chitinophagales bacterium]|nr:DUF898 family protein [Chitinophagales bacterium]
MDGIKRTRFKFHGSGSALLGIYFLNLIFVILTLGLYYPWARAKLIQYFYGETELEGSRFQFHGTGKEMFLGFIKAVAVVAFLYAALFAAQLSGIAAVRIGAFALYFLVFIAIVPFAIHGALRYRLSRTSYKGIHFGYRGNLKELVVLFVKGTLLSIVTLGIYGPWFEAAYRQYTIGKIRVGNASLEYDGGGNTLFLIHFKGIVFSILTLGVYVFWYIKNLYHFQINHVKIRQGNTSFRLNTSVTAGDVFAITIATYAALFTLGLALPWAVVYSYRVILNSISIEEGFDPEQLEQTEEDYNDATGEDLTDMLDIGMV